MSDGEAPINSTSSNAQVSEPITMESLLEAVDKVKDLRIHARPKIIILCKKHYKAMEKQFISKSPVYSVFPYHSPFGLEVKFYIRPYLKKIRVLDAEQFEMQAMKDGKHNG